MTDTKVTKEFIKTTLEQQFKRLADKAANGDMSVEHTAQITLAMCSLVSDIALLTAVDKLKTSLIDVQKIIKNFQNDNAPQ